MTRNRWENVSFVLSSNYRIQVLKALNEPNTPTQLAKKLQIDRPNVSRVLIDLTERGLVKCLTPNVVRTRFYERTKEGEEILKYLNK